MLTKKINQNKGIKSVEVTIFDQAVGNVSFEEVIIKYRPEVSKGEKI